MTWFLTSGSGRMRCHSRRVIRRNRWKPRICRASLVIPRANQGYDERVAFIHRAIRSCWTRACAATR
jgi:hypothetical protein